MDERVERAAMMIVDLYDRIATRETKGSGGVFAANGRGTLRDIIVPVELIEMLVDGMGGTVHPREAAPTRSVPMSDLTPPSADLLPPIHDLRRRLAIALREADLLRRLIRAAEAVRPDSITTSDRLPDLHTATEGGRHPMPAVDHPF